MLDQTITITEKTCWICKELKPVELFYRNKNKKDGLGTECKICQRIAVRSRYEGNKEEINKKRSADPKAKAWRIKNKDKIKERSRAHYLKHKETPEFKTKHCVTSHNRRARIAKTGGTHTIEDIKLLMEKQKCKCAVCREPIKNEYHIDHIMPIILGGTNDKRNLQLLCPPCNRRKNSKDPITFMQENGFLI